MIESSEDIIIFTFSDKERDISWKDKDLDFVHVTLQV